MKPTPEEIQAVFLFDQDDIKRQQRRAAIRRRFGSHKGKPAEREITRTNRGKPITHTYYQ